MHYGAYGSPIDPVAPPSRYLKLPVWTRTGGLSVSTSGMLRLASLMGIKNSATFR